MKKLKSISNKELPMPLDNSGHRARLKERFVSTGFDGLMNYEVIELLLTFGIPRKDCKPLAKLLIAKYKTVTSVIFADIEELKKFDGLGEKSVIGLKIVQEAYLYIAKESIGTGNLNLGENEKLVNYLRKKIGFSKKEEFVLVCTDTKGNMIHDLISIGTLDSSIVHPREVFKKAIENNSKYIIIAHNHPSGDASPSQEDILTTRKLVEAGKIIDIELVDHLIITPETHASMKELKYI